MIAAISSVLPVQEDRCLACLHIAGVCVGTMSLEMDLIEWALNLRAAGGGVFGSGSEELDRVLKLHYRVTYHAFDRGTKRSVWEVLLAEAEKIDSSKGMELEQAVMGNVFGILYRQLGDETECARWLAKLGALRALRGEYPEFWALLLLENVCYREAIGVEDQQQVFRDVARLPKETHTLTWFYLERFLARVQCERWQAVKEFGGVPLAYLLEAVREEEGVDQWLLEQGRAILSRTRFPAASEKNSTMLEEFHAVLNYYLRKNNKPRSTEWEGFITDSLGVTFQSVNVSKAALTYYRRFGDTKLALLNLLNFFNYSERFRRMNNGFYDDIVSLLDAYTFVLQLTSLPEAIGDIFNKAKAFEQLRNILQEFYRDYRLQQIPKEHSADWLSNSAKVVVPPKLARLLSDSWFLLYRIERNSLKPTLDFSLTYYLANAMCINPLNIDVKFHYAYVLASIRRIDMCIRFLKTNILNIKPADYRSWHLLALCESIQEDKDVSFKIVCSVLKAMAEAHEESNLLKADKWQFIHIKLTQLVLVKEMFGVKDALEMLSEVYQLYASLFPASKVNKTKDESRLGPAHNQTKEYLFQAIWFFSARLFLQDGDAQNAREAIDEAKRVTDTFTNLNVNITHGYLKLHCDPKGAMSEFQNALSFDPTNVDAVVGLAKLLYPEDQGSLERIARHRPIIGTATPKPESDPFANSKDRSAAVAQLKMLLENCIEKSIDGYHTPEVWWYLSRIYDEFHDNERLESALWQCIKFHELEPIRDFKYCMF
ncbi:ACL113Cp [Eremothecium gossypii ATCC 10895]|nr:ACL113Cp [Eremothecium gossypii ATCC 10895]AAS51115.1 ACL113Cp [Eremothecium gossypii ATCC 10895]